MSRKPPQPRTTQTNATGGLKDLSNKFSKVQINTKPYVNSVRNVFKSFPSLLFRANRRQSSSKTAALDNLIESIKNGKYRRIIVLAGAGISTPSGIPDFR